jgi:HK97 gp10 family phage protein
MSEALTIRVTGLPKLNAKLNKYRMISVPVRDFFLTVEAGMQQSAYEHAAKDTGAMANAIHGIFDAVSFTLVAPVSYSPYQEFGTWKMAAHPFMRPALEEARAEISSSLLGRLATNIERGMAI